MDEPEHVASARAVYDHSAARYVEFAGTVVTATTEAPLDRAVISALVEMVAANGSGPVLDVGCGSGRIAAFLADRGLDARGVDLSPRMIEVARSAHPTLSFDVGRLTALPVPDRSLLAAVYWYSIIATPPSQLSAVWAELDRVLDGRGQVLVAFQAGENEPVTQPDAHGSGATLTLYRHAIDGVAGSLADAGFEVRAQISRQPEFSHEATPQAMVVACRPGERGGSRR